MLAYSGILIWFCAAANCLQEATWPKLIGYGEADTDIIGIDRRASDGMLVLQLTTGEDDLIANAGTSTDTMSYAAFDPDDELYKWFKVFQGVTYNGDSRQATV